MESNNGPDPALAHPQEVESAFPQHDFMMNLEPEHEKLPRRSLMFNDRVILDLDLDNLPLKEFVLFPCLPCEIRTLIWIFALEKHRFIRLYHDTINQWCGATDTYFQRNEERSPGSSPESFFDIIPTSGQRYLVNEGPSDGITSRRLPSPVLAVNHESRLVAEQFYYLKLPAYDNHSSKTPHVLYLNPNWDHVFLVATHPISLIKFLWDCRFHDYQERRGIKHLVLTPDIADRLVTNDFNVVKTGLTAPFKQAVGSLMGRMETITYFHVDRDHTDMEGHLGPSNRPPSPLTPLYARPAEFTLFEGDPRPKAHEALKSLTVKGDPIRAEHDYRALMKYCYRGRETSGTPVPMAKVMHMICAQPQWMRGDDLFEWINDREDFEAFLWGEVERLEEMKRQEVTGKWEVVKREFLKEFMRGRESWYSDAQLEALDLELPIAETSAHLPDPTAESTSHERVAGFWLLPTVAFRHKKTLGRELNEYSIATHGPQLGVFSLPLVAKRV
ncbi:hypothetical protein GQ53DRAFT_768840 [Thozetella sp. PMI_491]|nr:hypothetical protein GQ53DRAFT_768840 [Thozetella sp. PMI_491]